MSTEEERIRAKHADPSPDSSRPRPLDGGEAPCLTEQERTALRERDIETWRKQYPEEGDLPAPKARILGDFVPGLRAEVSHLTAERDRLAEELKKRPPGECECCASKVLLLAICDPCLSGLDEERAGDEKSLAQRDERIRELEEALRVQDPRNAADTYELIAEDYRKKFGWLAPGKSIPLAMGSYGPEDEAARHATWRPFVNKWHEKFFDDALRRPTGSEVGE